MTISWGALFLIFIAIFKIALAFKLIIAENFAWISSIETVFILIWGMAIPCLFMLAMMKSIKTEWDVVIATAMFPTSGFIIALIYILISKISGETKWAGYATIVLFIHLLNLLPITPLVGGRLMTSLLCSPSNVMLWAFFSLIGTLGLWFLLINQLYLFLILTLIGGVEMVIKTRNYYLGPGLTTKQWLFTASWYVMLILMCAGTIMLFQHDVGLDFIAKLLKST